MLAADSVRSLGKELMGRVHMAPGAEIRERKGGAVAVGFNEDQTDEDVPYRFRMGNRWGRNREVGRRCTLGPAKVFTQNPVFCFLFKTQRGFWGPNKIQINSEKFQKIQKK